MAPENVFGDFEADFRAADKAPLGSTPGRVPPGTYKFILTTSESDDELGLIIDYDIIESKAGTKGFKVFCEILEPEKMTNPKTGELEVTKGKVVEHVFWITKNNLPFIKRDISTILGRDPESLGELTRLTWAGRTFEGVVRDEAYLGVVRSRIAFINPWRPQDGKGESKAETKKIAAPKSAKSMKDTGQEIMF
jgi:hypothetical protein